jgi:hypothetical protein
METNNMYILNDYCHCQRYPCCGKLVAQPYTPVPYYPGPYNPYTPIWIYPTNLEPYYVYTVNNTLAPVAANPMTSTITYTDIDG